MNFLSLYKRYIKFILKKKINIDIQPDFKDKKLEDLFIYYGTDKAQTWKNKENIGHGYTQFYEKHFEQIRSKKLNILEIGSYAGASAASFKKYFYNSNIYCLDVNISNFKFSSKNIQVFGIDVSNQKKIMKFFKKIGADKTSFFDIIIDDGSHKLSDILLSLNTFIYKLNKNGYYVIEDFKLPNFKGTYMSNYQLPFYVREELSDAELQINKYISNMPKIYPSIAISFLYQI